MANQETDELDCKRKEIEKLSLLNELLRRDKERLEDELSDMFTELHNTDSEAEQCVGGLQVELNETRKSLKKAILDLCRAEEASSSLNKLQTANEALTREKENVQRENTELKEDIALQMEKEQLFSNLKNHLIEKLAEKEALIAQQNGQLEALKIEISSIMDRACSDEGDINTSYALLDHDLQQKNTKQRKRLNGFAKEDEILRAELRQHMVNLKMIGSGINALISDQATPASVVQSLKLLKHTASFSMSKYGDGVQEKKIKIEENLKEEYQEYFEPINVKREDLVRCNSAQGDQTDLETPEENRPGFQTSVVAEAELEVPAREMMVEES